MARIIGRTSTFQEKALKNRKPEKDYSLYVLGVLFLILMGILYSLTWGSISSNRKTDESSDSPPRNITVNGERWQVVSFAYDSDKRFDDKRAGQTECAGRFIFYDPSRAPEKALLREVIWHEVVHAGHCKLEDKNSVKHANWAAYAHDMPEHNSVYELGMFLPGFVHDNPEFMKWAEDWK